MAAARNLYLAICRKEQARGVGRKLHGVVLTVVAECQYRVGHRFESRLTVFLVDASATLFLLKLFNKMHGMNVGEGTSRQLRKIIPFSLFLFNLLKPTGHVMHQQFNIQQLYVLPTLYSRGLEF